MKKTEIIGQTERLIFTFAPVEPIFAAVHSMGYGNTRAGQRAAFAPGGYPACQRYAQRKRFDKGGLFARRGVSSRAVLRRRCAILQISERMGNMSKYYVEGGGRLSGEVAVHGAKNAVLPILAGALLTPETVLHNVPALSDVAAACNILEYLGCATKREAESLTVKASQLSCHHIPDYLMREMRSSVVFLGAIIARCGKARVSLPGGCERKWSALFC
jgi:UDP-N-acetylglucosamine enolpyruvyl transferase